MRKVFAFSFIFFLIFSCNNKSEKSLLIVKHPFLLSETEKHFLNTNDINKLFVRFFNIDRNEKNELIIKHKIVFSEKPTRQYRIVPIVELTDRALSLQSEIEIERLSNYICNNLLSISTQANLNEIIEVAFVCQISNLNLQKNLYSLIKFLNKNDFFSDKIISLVFKISHINSLDQNVVRVADRLIIDFGNTGNTSDYNTINSLFDWNSIEPLMSYLIKLKKQLGIMLTVQSRTLVFRKNKYYCLINNTCEKNFKDKVTYEKVQLFYYKVLKKTYFSGVNLEQGDILKTESPNLEDYKKIARYLNKQKIDIIIYPINDYVIKLLEDNDIDISNIFDYFD